MVGRALGLALARISILRRRAVCAVLGCEPAIYLGWIEGNRWLVPCYRCERVTARAIVRRRV